MENLEQNLNRRDYDKEPLIIKNNFITYLKDLYAMLIVNSLWVYGVFYSGAIDWDNGEHLETFLTALHDPRLYEGTLMILCMDIITLVRIFKNLMRQHKVYLYENKIFFSHKDITINKSQTKV